MVAARGVSAFKVAACFGGALGLLVLLGWFSSTII
jgi:hypothetical protein